MSMTQEQWDNMISHFLTTLEREERKSRRACPECLLDHVVGEIRKANMKAMAEAGTEEVV